MTTLNIFAKSVGIIFFFIFSAFLYKLVKYSPGSFLISDNNSGALLLAVFAFMSFLISIFLIRLKSKDIGPDSNRINIRIVRFGFIFLGIYALYEMIIYFTNPLIQLSLYELDLSSYKSLITIFYLILFIIYNFLYFLIPYFINKNYKWSYWLGIGLLLFVIYSRYKLIEFFYQSYLGYNPYSSSSIKPSYCMAVFSIIIIIWSLFSIIVLYKTRKTSELITRI